MGLVADVRYRSDVRPDDFARLEHPRRKVFDDPRAVPSAPRATQKVESEPAFEKFGRSTANFPDFVAHFGAALPSEFEGARMMVEERGLDPRARNRRCMARRKQKDRRIWQS